MGARRQAAEGNLVGSEELSDPRQNSGAATLPAMRMKAINDDSSAEDPNRPAMILGLFLAPRVEMR